MNSNRGMSALELSILTLLLLVIGFVTFPKFRLMLYQSREARTKSSLGELRGALSLYYSDNSGLFPSDEGDETVRLKESIVPKYREKMPMTELTHLYGKKKSTVQDRLDDQGDWYYSVAKGFVGVNSTKNDTKDKPISNW